MTSRGGLRTSGVGGRRRNGRPGPRRTRKWRSSSVRTSRTPSAVRENDDGGISDSISSIGVVADEPLCRGNLRPTSKASAEAHGRRHHGRSAACPTGVEQEAARQRRRATGSRRWRRLSARRAASCCRWGGGWYRESSGAVERSSTRSGGRAARSRRAWVRDPVVPPLARSPRGRALGGRARETERSCGVRGGREGFFLCHTHIYRVGYTTLCGFTTAPRPQTHGLAPGSCDGA